jgi:hypothetical protein
MNEVWIWNTGAMILTGKTLSSGRKICPSATFSIPDFPRNGQGLDLFSAARPGSYTARPHVEINVATKHCI